MQPVFDYVSDVFPDHAELFTQLSNNLQWLTRRDGCHRDELYIYRDSSKPQHPVVEHVWQHIQKMAQMQYNSCCAERFMQRLDGFNWRNDSVKSIDTNRPLVIANFGDCREIWFKEFGPNASQEVHTKYLFGGGVLFLPPKFQEHFRYKLSGDINTNPLITLSFRQLLIS